MITIQLQKFEGPLDLLLYLIRKEEMNIFDIKIHEITNQYLEFIKMMRELDLEVAGEFVAMAPTLIHIKSRMLLPQYNDQGELVENEDPRKELVQKLIEYQKFQEAARNLNERIWLGRDVWARGVRENLKTNDESIVLEDNALFSLIGAYRRSIKNFSKKVHRVAQKGQSIASRILEMRDKLVPGKRVSLTELIDKSKSEFLERQKQILISFLSLLELGKMGFVRVFQSETYGEIYVDVQKEVNTDVVSRVEEFDGLNAELAAEKLFSRASEADEDNQQLNLGPLVEVNAEEFELHDGSEKQNLSEDSIALTFVENLEHSSHDRLETASEMATDEEILAAEREIDLT